MGHTKLRSYFNANVCLFFIFIDFSTILKGRCLRRVVFVGGMDAFALLYFTKIWGFHVRGIDVCGYGYIHGYPQKICGYGYRYGWEILYPRQA